MSFPGGAQAENEPQSAGRQTGLIGVRNDGRIEQRGGFQRVFGQEIGADQQLPLFGDFLIGRQQLADLFEAFQEELANLLVPLGEFGGDFIQERRRPRSSGSAMILAMILPTRSGSPGLKGRRRTRDWSGLRIVARAFDVN